MKKILVPVLCLGLAAPAVAQTSGEPQMSQDMIVEDTASSAQGMIVPILAIILIILALSGGSSAGSAPAPT